MSEGDLPPYRVDEDWRAHLPGRATPQECVEILTRLSRAKYGVSEPLRRDVVRRGMVSEQTKDEE